MNAQECLQLLRDVRDCTFATVDEQGRPQARIIDVMIVEEGALYFCTSRGKDFHAQLERDGHVTIVGMNERWQTVRLEGVARKLDEQRSWIDRIFEENPTMNTVYPGEARYILDAFCIDAGEIEFFDLGDHPIERERMAFGGEAAPEVRERGFRIGDGCIGCGICKANCPQECIDEGAPFRIQAEHCLHCGLCWENCPVQAIERL